MFKNFHFGASLLVMHQNENSWPKPKNEAEAENRNTKRNYSAKYY